MNICTVVLLPGGGFAAGKNYVMEGKYVYFHEGCYPTGSTGYRQKQMPAVIDDGAG